MQINDLLDADWIKALEEYVGGYHLRHLMIEIDLSSAKTPSQPDFDCIVKKLTNLRDMTSPEEKLIFTLDIINYCVNSSVVEYLVGALTPTVLVIRRLDSREGTIQALDNAADYLSNLDDSRPLLGMSGLASSELQYFFNARRGIIKFVCLGCVQYPDIKVHCTELAHSHGCNTILTIPPSDTNDFVGLQKYSQKYDKSNAEVLVKAILQLGTLVSFSRYENSSFMRNNALRLGHPFTHLQVC